MTGLSLLLRRNRTLWITLTILILLFLLAVQGMSTQDWVITTLRGLSVGAVTFLTAAGLSLIFGLMDVLNLAHGTLFMIGAYVGWTVYIRPDTFVDLLAPMALIAAGFVLTPVCEELIARLQMSRSSGRVARLWPWGMLILTGVVLIWTLARTPIAAWDAGQYDQSPIAFTILLEQGQHIVPPAAQYTDLSPIVGLASLFLAGGLGAVTLAGFARRRSMGMTSGRLPRRALITSASLIAAGVVLYLVNDALTHALFDLNTTWLFLIALAVAALSGIVLGGLMESTLIRPLYARPIYQLMLTLGLGVIGIEVVRAVWGRSQINIPNPSLFNATGPGCPAQSIGGWLANDCSTITFLGGRIRTYNEIFVIAVGVVVLVVVWLLLQRSRLGMIIRAGVQDREMVEALGINVRRVFTLVFAIGVGLATLGGALAGPSLGVSPEMGEVVLLGALIALVIGGLTSFPGAAAGAVIVGLLQQFIIKYGQIGIRLPFLAEPLKPTPPLVPASTVLLMVVILLALPQGLFGRKE
jgi:branched-chain amino acid transport system permease protein